VAAAGLVVLAAMIQAQIHREQKSKRCDVLQVLMLATIAALVLREQLRELLRAHNTSFGILEIL
jgi:hypothetical protein